MQTADWSEDIIAAEATGQETNLQVVEGVGDHVVVTTPPVGVDRNDAVVVVAEFAVVVELDARLGVVVNRGTGVVAGVAISTHELATSCRTASDSRS